MIRALDWDTTMLGLTAARLFLDDRAGVDRADLDTYDLVLARVPHLRRDTVVVLENDGFRYVGLDLALGRPRGGAVRPATSTNPWRLGRLRHTSPEFDIQGFQVDDSRFMVDARCRRHLPADFWDRVVREHCESFADTVIWAIDSRDRLGGFISCLRKPQQLDMFLVAVHPDHQNQGLGGLLVDEVLSLADEWDLPVSTNVMASNTRGLNFYLRHQFVATDGEVVMHRWRDEA